MTRRSRRTHAPAFKAPCVMCGRPLGFKNMGEDSDGRVDCVHVSGLLMRPMTAGPDGIRDPVPNVDGPLLARCFAVF
jgi:hypothetical protein